MSVRWSVGASSSREASSAARESVCWPLGPASLSEAGDVRTSAAKPLAVLASAVLRRANFTTAPMPPAREPDTLGDITVNYAQHTVTLKGEPVAVTPIEYAILTTLIRQPDVLVTSDSLLETVWGSEYAGETHILQVNVHRLRRKIEADPAHPTYIVTQPGVGYRMPTPTDHAAS